MPHIKSHKILKSGLIILTSCGLLTACGKSNEESYKSKVTRYENGIAQVKIDEAAKDALNLANQNIAEVKLITHESEPIPIIYKTKYQEMGFDTSKMNFYEPNWYTNQQQYKSDNSEEIELLNSGELNKHDHQH